MKTLPLYVFVGPSSLPSLRLLCWSLAQFSGLNRLVFVTPRSLTASVTAASLDLPCDIVNDEDVPGSISVLHFLRQHSQELLVRSRSANWYYQQYLKLAVAWFSDDYVFIQDGDTIFSAMILNELALSPQVLCTRENIRQYDAGLSLIGLPKVGVSCIANGGVFCPRLLARLGADPKEWFLNAFIRSVISSSLPSSDFSEYQVMGSLMSCGHSLRQISLFRRLDLLSFGSFDHQSRFVARALNRYDAVAFEWAHRGSRLKRLGAMFKYVIGQSW